MALGAILAGLSLVSSLAGQRSASRAADRERKFFQGQLAERRADPILAQLQGQFEQAQQDISRVPAFLRRQRESALVSQAQVQRQRVRESLSRAGVTGASEVGIRAERGQLANITQQRSQGLLQDAQLTAALRGRAGALGTNVLNQKFGSAGQAVAGIGQSIGQFVNPAQPFTNALTAFAIGNQFGGGGGGTGNINQFGTGLTQIEQIRGGGQSGTVSPFFDLQSIGQR